MAVLVQFNFRYLGPFGETLADSLDRLARTIAAEEGLQWKIWIENEGEEEAGGIYLFDDETVARAYIEKHTERLSQFGVTGVEVKVFQVNPRLTTITRGPVT